MKKLIALLLALVLCLSLCACGGGNSDTPNTPGTNDIVTPQEVRMTKEEMLANAVEIDDYEEEFESNKLRAEEKYIGNNYLVVGNIVSIESTHIEIKSIVNNTESLGIISVSLPEEDIMKLTTGQRVQVLGHFEAFTEEEMVVGTTIPQTYYIYNGVMTNGYVITDIFEFSGLLRMSYLSYRDINGKVHQRYGDPSAWQIGLDTTDDNVLAVDLSMENEIPVDHILGQNITSVQFGGQEIANGTKITVSAKLIDNKLVDVELLSVG